MLLGYSCDPHVILGYRSPGFAQAALICAQRLLMHSGFIALCLRSVVVDTSDRELARGEERAGEELHPIGDTPYEPLHKRGITLKSEHPPALVGRTR